MGLLVDGVWHDNWYSTEASGGRFIREESQFRQGVGAAGSPFASEAGRYVLYVSLACPWAHRTLIARVLKGLESVIDVVVVSPDMGSRGWTFEDSKGGREPERGYGFLYELYIAESSTYSGRVTVPVLWDRQTGRIVNNESSEILRILDSGFTRFATKDVTLFPACIADEIDEINAFVYSNINNGVYRCGFATTQAAYEEAFNALFAALDILEVRLSRQPYLVGEQPTEADWRLFTTLVRFDAVYVGHFKCNLRRIADYPQLSAYLRALYQVPGIAQTVDMDQIKGHYYRSHPSINPSGVVPLGPELSLDIPHDRGRFFSGR